MNAIRYNKIEIKEGFWKEKLDMISDVTLRSVYDRFEQTKRFAALDCSWKEGEPDCPHVFWDSDVAKWIESAAYIIHKSPDKELEDKIEIYPNPVDDILYIKLKEDVKEINVYNIYGIKMSTVSVQQSTVIVDMSGFNPGIYFVEIGGKVVRIVRS